jgi:AcrR family transcriptional regulator
LAQKSEDLRVLRTRKLLQKALIEITSEKGFADVTVRDITERAMVNRSTFYRHYLDKYELLGQYLDELYALIDSQEGDVSLELQPDQRPGKSPDGLVSLLRHMQLNADFYRVMLSEKGDPAFCIKSFRRYLEKGLHQMLTIEERQVDLSKPPIDLIVSYLLHGGAGAIVWWLENDRSSTPEQIAVWLKQLSMANLNVSLEPNGKAADG